MWLIDTTYLIDLVSGDQGAKTKAVEMDKSRGIVATSVITAQEYLRGIYYLFLNNEEKLASKLRKAESEIAQFTIVEFNYSIAKLAAKIDADLAQKGKIISLADTLIGATALSYGLRVVTRNVEHFQRIENLSIESY